MNENKHKQGSQKEENSQTESKHTNPNKVSHWKETFFRLIGYLKPYRMRLFVVLLAAMMSTVFMVLGPKIIGDAVTVIFEGAYGMIAGTPGAGIDFGAVGKILLLLIGLYLASSLFSYIQQFVMAGVAQRTIYDLRQDVNHKLEKLPLKYYDGHPVGDTLSRMSNDIDLIGTTLQQSITQFITSMITILGILVMMFWISPLLAIISLLSLPLSLFVIRPFLSRSQKHFADQQRTLGNLNGHVEEMYNGHQVVKAFSYEKESMEQFDEVNEELYDAGRRAQFISGMMAPLMSLTGNITYVLICIIGGVQVMNGTIRIGDIQAFIQYTRQFSQPIMQMANIANVIQSTIAASERVFELLDEEKEVKEESTQQLTDVRGEVTFEQVDFGYTSDLLIKDMNVHVRPGQTVAIVGPTGAGKTTLINLLMRFYEINHGSIKVDGVDIQAMSRYELRKIFGIVLQDTWLFNGTIKDNIAYGKENAQDPEIKKAAQMAYADHFISTLPDGYETVLNEEASNISQGQKQLLTIARTILANSPIMILDEATSSVDTRTEMYIQEAMNHLMAGRTSFVIAHRLSTIKNADLILVMDQGNIIEQGTHDELLEEKGFYADLYNSQFSNNPAI